MEKGYRVPDIKEFIEGFEYEIAHDWRVDYLQFVGDDNKIIKGEPQRTWNKSVVPNMGPTEYPYSFKKGEMVYTIMNGTEGYDDPLSTIKGYLPQGLIRTKISKK